MRIFEHLLTAKGNTPDASGTGEPMVSMRIDVCSPNRVMNIRISRDYFESEELYGWIGGPWNTDFGFKGNLAALRRLLRQAKDFQELLGDPRVSVEG